MFTLVSMVRGINVGGSRPLKMDALRGLHEDLGFRNVRTHLQSGNVVFEAASRDTARQGDAIERRILRDCGYEVAVAVKTSGEMTAALAGNPHLGRGKVDPRHLYATFLVRPDGKRSLAGAGIPLARGEEAVLQGEVIYLYCPFGYETRRYTTPSSRRGSPPARPRATGIP